MTENTTAVQILMEDIFQLREICSPLNTIKPSQNPKSSLPPNRLETRFQI